MCSKQCLFSVDKAIRYHCQCVSLDIRKIAVSILTIRWKLWSNVFGKCTLKFRKRLISSHHTQMREWPLNNVKHVLVHCCQVCVRRVSLFVHSFVRSFGHSVVFMICEHLRDKLYANTTMPCRNMRVLLQSPVHKLSFGLSCTLVLWLIFWTLLLFCHVYPVLKDEKCDEVNIACNNKRFILLNAPPECSPR